MSFLAPSARLGLRSQPLSRLYSTARPRIAAATTTAAAPMNAPVLLASAAVAVSAYVLYARSSASTAHAETAEPTPTFARFGFRTLTLASSEAVNHNVKHLRFDLPDLQATSGLPVTSALLTISFPGGSWIPTLRPYTPINDTDDRGHVDFLVKQYPGGTQSTYLHNMKPGDPLIFFRIPGYSWTPNEQAHIGIVAGGQGITPCYQLLRNILHNPQDNTRITLVWGVNTEADILLADELAALQKAHPDRLAVQYVISDPSAAPIAVPFTKGRITAEVLKSAGIDHAAGVGKVFMSGPPAMEKALRARGGILAEVGFTKKETYKF